MTSFELPALLNHAALLAQAGTVNGGDFGPWTILAIVVGIVAAALLAYTVGTRFIGRGGAEPAERPTIERAAVPTADTLSLRDELDEESFVELSSEEQAQLSIKERRLYNMRRQAQLTSKRATAVEATATSREVHQRALAPPPEVLEEEKVEAETPPQENVSAVEVSVVDAPADTEEAASKAPEVSELPEIGQTDDEVGSWAELGEDIELSQEMPAVTEEEVAGIEAVDEPVVAPRQQPHGKTMREGLQSTREGLFERLRGSLFKREALDDDILEDVEEILYTADLGPSVAEHLIEQVERRLDEEERGDPAVIWGFIRGYVENLLQDREGKLDVEGADPPFVILVVGVNGVGKTTTIGKLASRYKRAGKKVLLVAGDTFRAAAVEQLQHWAERTALPVHSGEPQADPASVVFDGIKRASEESFDVVICDTAGRLNTKQNLLDELGKIYRVAGKAMEGAPHETILVLDANTGQNAIAQARDFQKACDITGIVLTKLDGTARGGVILGICAELDAPVRFVGIGEGVYDLRPFDAEEFVDALFM